jgi:hypothetical protein
MALWGNLSVLTVPDLLQWIGGNAITGSLHVRNGDDEFSFWFRDGRLQSLASSQIESRFGRRLVRDGILSDAALPDLLKAGPLGRSLVDASVLTEHEVAILLRRHMLETSMPLLQWRDGTFEFQKVGLTQTSGVSFGLSAEELLLEGHRRLDERHRAA